MTPLAITAAKRLAPRIEIMMTVQATVRQSIKVLGGTIIVTPPT